MARKIVSSSIEYLNLLYGNQSYTEDLISNTYEEDSDTSPLDVVIDTNHSSIALGQTDDVEIDLNGATVITGDVQIDKTLTKSNMAADAKVVGDKFKEVNNDIVTSVTLNNGLFSFKNSMNQECFRVQLPIYSGGVI